METDIPAIIKEVLTALGVSYTGIDMREVAGQQVYQIILDNPQLLIGVRGETIRAVDMVVKRIAEKRGVSGTNFIVDANGFQEQYIRDIETRARMMAQRARSFEYDVEMPPMSAYERLIVHSVLAGEPNVKTESQGEGRERRVVIRYVQQSSEPSAV